MSKNTKEMGQYGYFKNYRKYKLTNFLILSFIMIADILATCLIFKTTKHYLILITVALALPFAKTAIALIVTRKHKPLTEEEYNQINQLEKKVPDLNIIYDVSVTLYEGVRFYQVVAFRNEIIVALVLYKESNINILAYKTHIEKSICNDKYVYEVNVVQNIDDFISAVENIEEPEHNTALVDEFMKKELLVFGTR